MYYCVYVYGACFFFFFKHKTAYEMRISDWSLDVCSSDLEFFFRSTDEDLDQQAAYPFMKPIFGEGVVFDASPERRKVMLHNSALRGKQIRGHAATIGREVEAMVAQWGDEGESDLLDFFDELTTYTSSACLIGKKFRDELDDSFAKLYHELEQGTDALAFVDPYAPIDSFRRRDEARLALVALVQDIMNGRIANPPHGKDDRDMLDVLVSVKDENGDIQSAEGRGGKGGDSTVRIRGG